MSLAAQGWDQPDAVRVRVPGKINLALLVGPRGDDGYHELATIFQAVSLFDEVTATLAPADITCTMRGAMATGVGAGIDNLAVRAADLLRQEYDIDAGVELTIDKSIPVAGGMAGGSADAAGTLVACARLWQLSADDAELAELGARLGADVPFLISGGCALGLGRGQRLTPTLSRGSYHWVLAMSDHGLSTPEVYARFDHLAAQAGRTPASPDLPRELMMALAAGNPREVGQHLVNDLEPPAFSLAPSLRTLLGVGRRAGALGGLVSGSGPTVAFLACDEDSATNLALELSSQGVAHQIRIVTGPVPGATVI
ncbi:MAG: 4-(cytidine 5'-diphospho)-2-C-methyl-D-erythritol kinase [Propionibacteriaceae bacterium]|jgi:4-diphosphocytidyl-2-C-methyl-D-erythritol kinase|nr:4-(cytidine 5'-diphospho)-2-C-methyl-D-erythritol kinase [Propionibacteriaceae bacterium]